MFRTALLVALLAGVTPAVAQNPVQWISSPQQGVAQAKRSLRPVLFYVVGSGDDDRNDIEDEVKKSFRDPGLAAIIQERFVPVRLQRTNNNLEMLKQIGAPTAYGNYLVVATPEGKLVGQITPQEAANVTTLARQLTTHFRSYRQALFDKELKPQFEAQDTQAGDIRRALKVVQEFIITEADEALVKYMNESEIPKAVENELYQTLAALSTPKAVDALFEKALTDKAAANALEKSTPGAAEYLLKELNSEEMDRFLLAYRAIGKICNLQKLKPDRFWEGDNKQLQLEEIERIQKEAQADSSRWQQRVAPYR